MKDNVVDFKTKKKITKPEVKKVEKNTDDKDPIKFLSMMAGLIDNDPNKNNTYNLTLILVKNDFSKKHSTLQVISTLDQLAEVNIDIDRAKNYVLGTGRIN